MGKPTDTRIMRRYSFQTPLHLTPAIFVLVTVHLFRPGPPIDPDASPRGCSADGAGGEPTAPCCEGQPEEKLGRPWWERRAEAESAAAPKEQRGVRACAAGEPSSDDISGGMCLCNLLPGKFAFFFFVRLAYQVRERRS